MSRRFTGIRSMVRRPSFQFITKSATPPLTDDRSIETTIKDWSLANVAIASISVESILLMEVEFLLLK